MTSARREDNRRKPSEVDLIPGVKSFWIQGFLGIALVLLLAAAMLLYLWVARDSVSTRDLLEDAADTLAVNVAGEMARIRTVVESWRDAPDLRAVFLESGSPDTLHQKEAELLARLPGALSIHLFAPEQTSSAEGIPFMSYAGLDLARQATQTRDLTFIEVNKVGQPDMHLAVATPVLDEARGRAVGVVHVALPMALLPNPLGEIPGQGLILYQQVVGDAVANLGSTAAPDEPPDHTAAIAGTRLRAAAWITHRTFLDPWLLGLVGAGYVAILALIAAVLWLAYSAQRRALLLDCLGFTTLIEDAVNRRPLRRIKTRIAEVQDAHQETLTLLRGLQPSRPPPRGVAAAGVRTESDSAPAESQSEGLRPTSSLSEPSVEVEEIELPDGFDPYSQPISQPASAPTPAPSPMEDLEAGLDSYGDPLTEVPAEVFRANDIRGLVDQQLTPEALRAIGQAIGSEAAARGDHCAMVGRDCRASSAALRDALVGGIRSTGLDVIDLGVVPTPLVYFACCHPEPQAGAIVTASHNPAEYNGVKIVFGGKSAQTEDIQALHRRILLGDVTTGSGGYLEQEVIQRYSEYVERDVALARNLKVVIDCGNATVSAVAPALFRALGCEVVELNCDLESGLPERLPDPAVPESTRDLADLVVAKGADLGLAFDGDGDRLGVIDSQGRFIAADRVLMLLAADILSRHPGTDIVYDVKCTRHLAEEIRRSGGRAVMWRSGHAQLKARLRESGALIAGELSGHIIFKERWFGFDDAIYAGARLLEVLSLDPRPTNELFSALPGGLATPELVLPLPEGEPTRIMRAVMRLADRLDGVEVIRIDGLRAEFDRGFGLVRASNTQPQLTFRFEGDDAEALEKIQALFRRLMEKAAPGLSMPF